MQLTANTTAALHHICRAARALLSIGSTAPHGYSVIVPGAGIIGDCATIEDVEEFLSRLPDRVRQVATVHDAEGYCVIR